MAKLISRISALTDAYDLRTGAPASGVAASPIASFPTHVLGRRGLRTHSAVVSLGKLRSVGNYEDKTTQPRTAMLRVHASPAAKALAIFATYALQTPAGDDGIIECGTSDGDDDVFRFVLRGTGRYNTGALLESDGLWHNMPFQTRLYGPPLSIANSGLGNVGDVGGMLDISARRSDAFWLYFRWKSVIVTHIAAVELPTLEF